MLTLCFTWKLYPCLNLVAIQHVTLILLNALDL